VTRKRSVGTGRFSKSMNGLCSVGDGEGPGHPAVPERCRIQRWVEAVWRARRHQRNRRLEPLSVSPPVRVPTIRVGSPRVPTPRAEPPAEALKVRPSPRSAGRSCGWRRGLRGLPVTSTQEGTSADCQSITQSSVEEMLARSTRSGGNGRGEAVRDRARSLPGEAERGGMVDIEALHTCEGTETMHTLKVGREASSASCTSKAPRREPSERLQAPSQEPRPAGPIGGHERDDRHAALGKAARVLDRRRGGSAVSGSRPGSKMCSSVATFYATLADNGVMMRSSCGAARSHA
jgi:hypothetical protein